MPVTKQQKTRLYAQRQRNRSSAQKTNGGGLTDEQIIELLEAYQTMGQLLEKLVGRERLYRPRFLKGLEQALHDVAMSRTQGVESFEDFAG